MANDKPIRSAKTEFDRVTNPDGTPVVDKDNAQPVPKPSFARTPAPNLAPGGATGIKQPKSDGQDQNQTPNNLVPRQLESGISVNLGFEDDAHLYTDGNVVTMPGYSFIVRIGDEPSRDGIEGGKIDQLVLKKDGETVARYDHGWEIDPKSAEQREAIQRIRNGLDDAPEKRISTSEHAPDKGHDMDR